MILSRLDDMKAEETVTIDLRGKSAFSDYMVVTTGRVNRHVGAIAENVTKGLKETGIKGIHPLTLERDRTQNRFPLLLIALCTNRFPLCRKML